jgi:acetyltransferase
MSIRSLDRVFSPRSVAIIGASPRAGSIGAILMDNLRAFRGTLYPVNPHHRRIGTTEACPSVRDLPEAPDLAVIATPAATVPDLIAELGERGTRAAVVISAGFAERGPEGLALQQALLDAARPHQLRVIGPNCIGVIVPAVGLNATFAHRAPASGRLAFVTQSGAIVTSLIDWASDQRLGFSHLVSLGDMSDVDFGDMLDFLANDMATSAILLYIESVTHARKFVSAARAAARSKPVIVVKSGRHPESAHAAGTHTGALAGRDDVYDAVFRRTGMLRVNALEDLFDAAEVLRTVRQPRGERLAILTNGGGIGVLATDALIDLGGVLAELGQPTVDALDGLLPAGWPRGNPVDVLGDASADRYAQALQVLLAAPETDAVLVLHCPTAVVAGAEVARAVADLAGRYAGKPVVTSWLGGPSATEADRLFAEKGIANYPTPERAISAFMHIVAWRRAQTLLMETPPSVPEDFAPDTAGAAAIVGSALAAGREWLAPREVHALLACYSIPMVELRIARSPDEAAEVASELRAPLALKIASPDIVHKTDAGGIALHLPGPAEVREAAAAMQARIGAAHPGFRLEGFVVQPMIERPQAHELIVGATCDEQFGPIVLFGHGGTAVELLGDRAVALPPLNMRLARELISRTRIGSLLRGYRDRPSANLDAIALTLIKVAQLMVDLDAVQEIDVNPLLADQHGVLGLDARVRIAPAPGDALARLAIRPYPKELEREITLPDGRSYLLRPIMPEDEPALQRLLAGMSPQEIHMRFMMPLRTLSHTQAARFTQLDYDREMALVLCDRGRSGEADLHAEVRLSIGPDNLFAEFSVIVRHDLTRRGLGRQLMSHLIEYARSRGISELRGDILRENTRMLALCRALGFELRADAEEPTLMRATLVL